MRTNNFYNTCRENHGKGWQITAGIVLLCLAAWLGGCDEFTEVGMPITELNSADVFENKGTAYAVLTELYADMRENGMLIGKAGSMSRELGLYADELQWYGSSTAQQANFYNNTVLPSASIISNWWNNSYSQIYAANAIIEGVAASKSLSEADKKQLNGEARFVRGLYHFYLMQVYGEVPYTTSLDYHVNVSVSRMPAATLYQHIVEDLTAASELLPDEYLSVFRVRPNSFAAQALLARVYLYKGDYAQAANSASAVLNNTGTYGLPQDIATEFLKESPATIWQFSPRTATRNTEEGTTFIFNAAPPSTSALSESLMNSFEAGDLRKTVWTRARSSGGNTWYHAFKYKKTATSSPQMEFPIVLRLAEMYLIRAEARAQQGELTSAKDDLNVIRAKAGLANTTAVTKQQILDAVLHERRVEFFTEYGHRFMDLKRMGKLDTFLSTKPSWETTDRLLPLPQREIDLNPNLAPQNSGY